MDADADRYEAWYTRKLWSLLPAIYRAEDSGSFDEAGPLQELVGRIGVQAAIVRRSIDRLWEDQMIETCDDWVVDYIGDLLSTNMVPSLDGRERRVGVGRHGLDRPRGRVLPSAGTHPARPGPAARVARPGVGSAGRAAARRGAHRCAHADRGGRTGGPARSPRGKPHEHRV